MLPVRIDHSYLREKALGDHVRDVAADLRLIELSDIVAHLKTGQIASTGALVQSSIELSFRPDTLSFAYSGDVVLNWVSHPQVLFDMEFHHMRVHVYFRLLLEADQAGVEITYISFDEAADCPAANTQRLVEALGDARRLADDEAAAAAVYSV